MRSQQSFRADLSHRALAALIAALALVGAACSSGGSDETVTDDDSAGAESSDESSAAEDDDGDAAEDGGGDVADDDSDSEEADGGSEQEEAEPDASTDVATGSDFCSLYIENLDLVQEFDFFDPVQVEQWIGTSVGLLDQAIADAPGEIQADLATIRADFDTLVDTLEDFDYDFFAASEAVDAITDTAEVDAASARIEAYVESTCGIDVDAIQDQATEDLLENNFDSILGNETLLAEIVAGMTEGGEMTEAQATCLLENLDTDLLAGLAADGGAAAMGDPDVLAELFGTFATCGIDLG